MAAGPMPPQPADGGAAYPPRNGNGRMTSHAHPSHPSLTARPSNGRAATNGRRTPSAKPQGFRAVAAPVLATVGGLLLIPAVWATLLLGGVEVPGSRRSDAASMAMFMLMCWPVAICLIAASVHFFLQVMKAKKQALEELRARAAAASAGNPASVPRMPTAPARPIPRRR